MEQRGIIGHVILGLSIVGAAAIFGMFFYLSRNTESTVRVVGAVTKRFDSDLVKCRIFLGRIVSPSDVQAGYQQIGKDVTTLIGELEVRGVSEKDISVQPPNAIPAYGREGNITGYTVQQSLFIISSEVDKVEQLALNPSSLLTRGIVLQSMQLEYYSAQLSEIKLALLAEATLDARKRAQEIARTDGMSVEQMVSARAGVFQITEPYSTEVSDYGVYNTSTREKDITVTVNASFVLR